VHHDNHNSSIQKSPLAQILIVKVIQKNKFISNKQNSPQSTTTILHCRQNCKGGTQPTRLRTHVLRISLDYEPKYVSQIMMNIN
jgi:hypothetical protein